MAVKILAQSAACSNSPVSVKYFIITSVNVETSSWDSLPFYAFTLKQKISLFYKTDYIAMPSKSIYQILYKANKNLYSYREGAQKLLSHYRIFNRLSRRRDTTYKISPSFSVSNFFPVPNKAKIIQFSETSSGRGYVCYVARSVCQHSLGAEEVNPPTVYAYIQYVFTLLNINLKLQLLTTNSVIDFTLLFLPASSCIFVVCSHTPSDNIIILFNKGIPLEQHQQQF